MTEIVEVCKNIFIFRGLSDNEIRTILDKISVKVNRYSRGETIYSQNEFDNSVGFILDGKCAVKHPKEHGVSVTLNLLGQYDSFGITAAFSNPKRFPTEIIAIRNSKLMFIRKDDLISLTGAYPTIAFNVIDFLVDRISFLNKKIDTFTKVSTENKVVAHILSESKRLNSKNFTFNCKKASEAVNVGRASVYRALNKLVDDGTITYENNKIFILDLDGLERISK